MIVNYPRMRRRAAWPNDLDTALQFASANPFSISSTKGWNGKIEYTNGSEWKEWDGSKITSGKIVGNHCIYLRGTGNTKITALNNGKWRIVGTNIACNGEIDLLLDYLVVKSGSRPAMENYCYYSMFQDCTNLTTAPALPATTLANDCYSSMFRGCTNLTTAPALPATTLATYCYNYMFQGCTNLTTAPALPATTLATFCYNYMFQGCTNLTTAPALPATTLARGCYSSMFRGCTNLTTAPALPATTLARSCYYSMFQGCTKIKLSSKASGTYTKAYRIPKSGTGQNEIDSMNNMFVNTGGAFAETPEINTTYYLDKSNTIV